MGPHRLDEIIDEVKKKRKLEYIDVNKLKNKKTENKKLDEEKNDETKNDENKNDENKKKLDIKENDYFESDNLEDLVFSNNLIHNEKTTINKKLNKKPYFQYYEFYKSEDIKKMNKYINEYEKYKNEKKNK